MALSFGIEDAIAAYLGEPGDDPTILYDSSPNARHGTFSGGAYCSPSGAIDGLINGSTYASTPSFPLAAGFALSIWFYYDFDAFQFPTNGGVTRGVIGVGNEGVSYTLRDHSFRGSINYGSATITTKTVYHIWAELLPGVSQKAYINGVKVSDEATSRFIAESGMMIIGSNNGSDVFRGTIWQPVLFPPGIASDAEIAQIADPTFSWLHSSGGGGSSTPFIQSPHLLGAL